VITGLVVEKRLDILDPLAAPIVQRRHPVGRAIARPAIAGRAVGVGQVRHRGMRIDDRIAEEHVMMRGARLPGEHQGVIMAGMGFQAMRAECAASVFPFVHDVVRRDETVLGPVREGRRMAHEGADHGGQDDGPRTRPAFKH